MTHPLEKLAEKWSESTPGGTPSPYDLGYASANQHCGAELSRALASLWRPFDPEDEGTWPRSGTYYIFCDDEHAPQAVMGFRAEMVDLWRSLKVTHYTELLPGPK